MAQARQVTTSQTITITDSVKVMPQSWWYGTVNLIDKPRLGDNIVLADTLAGISLTAGTSGTRTINVPDSISLADHRTVQLVSGGGWSINRADSVTVSDFADAEPILPFFEVIALSDSAIVQRWMSAWAGTVNLIEKPKLADVMTVIDDRVVSVSGGGGTSVLTIVTGEALENRLPTISLLKIDVGELLASV